MAETARCRVNIAISTKGVKTWDCTAESIVYGVVIPTDEALTASDYLVAELERRYPVKLEEEKK